MTATNERRIFNMTNNMIITLKQLELVEAGILHYTGRTIQGVNVFTGELADIPEIEAIHTYAHWKSLGYQVKKGEKAIIQFPIWKYTTGKKNESDEDEAQKTGHCFMKNSSWFSERQVERIIKSCQIS
jgi:hypothetical protein